VKLKKVFYGWWVVAAGSGINFLQSLLLLQSFGAYVAVLQDDRGYSKTALSGAAAMQQAEAALLGPLVGWFMDRFGPQNVIRTGVVLLGIGFMLLSTTDTLLTFYGAFVVLALGSSLCGFFPVNVALVHWFEKKRARALSMMSFGLALGGMAVPIVAWSLTAFGWRATAFASGVIVMLLGLPMSFVIKRRPEDLGLTRDGEPPAPPQTTPAGAASGPPRLTRDFTAREAIGTRAFWFLSLGHGFALFVVTAVNVHAVSHMKEELGYSIEAAAFAITLMTAGQMGGVGIGWMIADRYDKRLIAAVCMFMHMMGLLCLTYAATVAALTTAMVIAFAVLHGCAWGLRGPLMQAIRADYFGLTAIGMILGLGAMITVVGQIGGPMIAGILADVTGNYRVGFTLLALLAGLGSAFFYFARRPPRPAIEES
jgi:sugar phosphate permease